MRSALPADLPVADLVNDARRGSSAALAVLYRDHAGPLLRSLTLLLQERADAEDVVHDLFVGLPEALQRYEDRGAMRAWLGRIAARMALTRIRIRKQRKEVNIEFAAAYGHAADGERLPDRLLVEQAVARLAEPLRMVVVLRDLEGWPYGEIAEFVGASIGTVMTRHCRAMRRLKEAIEETR